MSELQTERPATREEVADYLREFADQLDGGGATDAEHRDRDRTGTETANTDASTGGTATGPDARSRSGSETGTGTNADAETDADATGDRTPTAHPAGKVTLLVGNDSATINPPNEVTFGVEVGSDSSLMSGDAEVVEFRMHWDANDVPQDDELRIE